MIPDTEHGTSGRSIRVQAFGDTASEVELDALDQAREFFGGDIKLAVVRSYSVSDAKHWGEKARGKRHAASVTIRAED